MRRLIVFGAAATSTIRLLKACTSRIDADSSSIESFDHCQPMNRTKAITSPRYARLVWSDSRRFTQASKILSTERKKLSIRSRFCGVTEPRSTGGSDRWAGAISFTGYPQHFGVEHY